MKTNINLKNAALVFALGLTGAAAGYAISAKISGKPEPVVIKQTVETQNAAYTPVRFAGAEETDFTTAAEGAIDGVVHVKTKYIQENEFDNPFYQFFFGMPQQQSQPVQASGSGVIISKDGYIVTNNHVVENSTSIEVVLNDRRSFDARLIGRDPLTDLALLKIDAADLTVIPFGNSDNLKIGEWVIAIGNPFNLTSTVTAGIVSAKARNINILDHQSGAIESFIQTDAAVNPGNSGGALINKTGQLVGINTAIASQTGNFAGYAFAVPVSIVQKVIADLMEYGSVQRALLGIHITDVTAEEAKENNLDKIKGIHVQDVMDGGTADAAGLKEGDIIISVGDKNTNTIAELQEVIARFRPGDKTQLSYVRNGKQNTVDITFSDNRVAENNAKNRELMETLGASFEELQATDLKKYGLKNGVQVKSVKSGKFMRAGIGENFIITEINGTRVSKISDIEQIINSSRGGVYIEGQYPNGRAGYYAFGIK